jgi:sec-independent protein translocase protein TatA
MGLEAPSHWIIIAVIVIALFGYKKMPDAARSIGRSLRIFKGELKDMTDHNAAPDTANEPALAPSVPAGSASAAPIGTPTEAPAAAMNGSKPDVTAN